MRGKKSIETPWKNENKNDNKTGGKTLLRSKGRTNQCARCKFIQT